MHTKLVRGQTKKEECRQREGEGRQREDELTQSE
jgi:hypothetical protein